MIFRTHTGEQVTGERLQAALSKVAQDWRDLTEGAYRADRYAPHVTQETKDANRARGLALADDIERGKVDSFTIWQRVNTAITGECVALFSK